MRSIQTRESAQTGRAVAALAGVSEGDAEHLKAAFGIKTVRDLGTNKYFSLAHALVTLGSHSG